MFNERFSGEANILQTEGVIMGVRIKAVPVWKLRICKSKGHPPSFPCCSVPLQQMI